MTEEKEPQVPIHQDDETATLTKDSQKTDGFTTMTAGGQTENPVSIEKETIDSTIKTSSSSSMGQAQLEELPKTGENRKQSEVMKWVGLFLLLGGIGIIYLNKNSYYN